MAERLIVAAGKAVTQNGKMFAAGTVFPAEELGLEAKQIRQLVEEGALAPEGRQPTPASGDGLEELSKAELQSRAEALGIEAPGRASKEELIALIRERG